MSKVVVLEFGVFNDLILRVNAGETIAEIEQKTITNYLHQERNIHGGFSSQGEAVFRIG